MTRLGSAGAYIGQSDVPARRRRAGVRRATDPRLIAAGVTHVARWHSEAGTLHLRDALTAAGVRWCEREARQFCGMVLDGAPVVNSALQALAGRNPAPPVARLKGRYRHLSKPRPLNGSILATAPRLRAQSGAASAPGRFWRRGGRSG